MGCRNHTLRTNVFGKNKSFYIHFFHSNYNLCFKVYYLKNINVCDKYVYKSNVVPQTTLSDYIDHQVLKDGPIQRDGIPTYVFSNPVSMKGVQLEAQDLFPQVFTF
jgi:hypothetical protein